MYIVMVTNSSVRRGESYTWRSVKPLSLKRQGHQSPVAAEKSMCKLMLVFVSAEAEYLCWHGRVEHKVVVEESARSKCESADIGTWAVEEGIRTQRA